MTKRTKLVEIENAIGIILPNGALERLGARIGDSLFLKEGPQGITLTTTDSDAIDAAEEIISEDRDILDGPA